MSVTLRRMIRHTGRVAAIITFAAIALFSTQNGLAAVFHSPSPLGYQEALIVALLAYAYLTLRSRLRLTLQRQIARVRRD